MNLLKKIAIASMFVLPLSAIANELTECPKTSAYQVKKVSFTSLSIQDAMKKITEGTPYQIQMDGQSTALIGASDIEGPLDQVISKLAKQSNFKVVADRCVLTVTQIKPPELWIVRDNESLPAVIKSWNKISGYTAAWEIPGIEQFIVHANATFGGSYEEVLNQFLIVLNKKSPWIAAHLYRGNKAVVFSPIKSNDNKDTRLLITENGMWIPVAKEVVVEPVAVLPPVIIQPPIVTGKKAAEIKYEGKLIQATQTTFVVKFEENKPISESLRHFFAVNGWDMQWDTQQDFIPKKSYSISGNVMDDVLLRSVNDYGLSITLHSDNRTVSVSQAKVKEGK